MERRKGFYKNRNRDKDKIIKTDYVAKYYVATKDRSPAIARNRTVIFFRDQKNFDAIFNEKNEKVILLITLMANNIIKNIKQINVKSSDWKQQEIDNIKTQFKYHIISMYYENYQCVFELDNLEKVLIRMLSLIKSYKKENDFESLKKLSTSIDFQDYMYKNLN